MKALPKISVVLPIYNQENYLSKCLESLVAQSFADFELLLIDDGSVDSTPLLCDSWSEKDDRIRVFHKKNGGVSSARNLGIEQSRGEYIVFVDPDDYVESDYLQHLFQLIPTEGADCGFIIQGYVKENEKGTLIEQKRFAQRKYSVADIDNLLKSEELGDMFSPWGKLFKRAFLINCELHFEPELSYFEDVLFILSCIGKSEYIVIGENTDYHYILRPGTLSKKINSFSSEYKAFDLCLGMIGNLAQRFRMGIAEVKVPLRLLHFPFSRALKTDYHHLEEVTSTDRNQHLAILRRSALNYMRLYYRPDYLLDKLGRLLLIHNWIWLYNVVFTILFKLGVKKMFCPPD